MTMTKLCFITGGVLSGLGKGITTAAIGKLLQFRGFHVDVIKIDPYLNVDPGTLNPIEHGEVFITDEVWEFNPAPGFIYRIAEIDQDAGTYERFLDHPFHPSQNITSGQIYLSVIVHERVGKFLGRTIQIVPHITDEVKSRIRNIANKENPDVLLIEIGGTVGDIEAMPFLEAIRQLRLELSEHDTCLVHVTLIPYLESVGQLKSKPTQHSVRTLQGMGLQPDIIVGRAKESLSEEIKRKISLYCSVPEKAVISNPDLSPIYDLPLYFEQQNMGNYLCSLLQLSYDCKPATEDWTEMVNLFKNATRTINIAMPGKYTSIIDSYVSINYALQDAGAHLDAEVNINWIDTEAIEEHPEKISVLDSCDGCLLTPGFGSRGVEGMIQTANYAIQKNIPYLGICFGAQLLTVAFARNVMGWKEAHTTEVDAETQLPVIDFLPEQKIIQEKGGTMRLGAQKIIIQEGTKLWDAYHQSVIHERFRHRYHIIEEYTGQMKEKGFITSAYDDMGKIVNAVEIADHPFCVGVQFHPEYTSRPNRPNPLYFAFIKHALERSTIRMNANE